MRLKAIKFDWSLAVTTSRFLLVSNIGLVLLLLIFGYMAFNQRERVILVPPHLDKRVEISWNAANADYYKGTGLYIATLLANVTPTNIQFVMDTTRSLFQKDVFAPIALNLMALSKEASFLRNTSINFFSPTKVQYEPELRKVFISGTITNSNFQGLDGLESTGVKVRPVIDLITYEMVFTMQDGRPLVTAFNSYPGDTAHTQKWLKQYESSIKEAKEAKEAEMRAATQSSVPAAK